MKEATAEEVESQPQDDNDLTIIKAAPFPTVSLTLTTTTTRSTTLPTRTYKEEVLGYRVQILFCLDKDDKKDILPPTFFPGTIRKCLMTVEEAPKTNDYISEEQQDKGGGDGECNSSSRRLEIKHFIVFDDGDERWFDLALEEREGRLEWIQPEVAIRQQSQRAVVSSRSRAGHHHTKTKKKRKRSSSPDENIIHHKGRNGERRGLVVVKKEMDSSDYTKQCDERLQHTSMSDDDDDDGGDVHPRFYIGNVKMEDDDDCTNNYGDDDENRELEEEKTVGSGVAAAPDPMPTTIAAILRYMDQIEPGGKYYLRQQDGSGQCSNTCKKLRRFARAHPDHPATRHWMETAKWEPPDAATLRALVKLIKTMI